MQALNKQSPLYFDFYRNMDDALVLYHELSTALAIAKTGNVREHLNCL
jgi:hypothetical protein